MSSSEGDPHGGEALAPSLLERLIIFGKTEKPADIAGLRQALAVQEKLERAKGLEPSTPTLARSCSTTELHPHPKDWRRSLAGNWESYAKCGPRMQQPRRGCGIGRSTGHIRRSVRKSAQKRPGRVPPIANWALKRQLGLGRARTGQSVRHQARIPVTTVEQGSGPAPQAS